MLNILNILNIFINVKYPSIYIIKLAYPQWICILIWNILKQHPVTRFSRHGSGEYTPIARTWQDKSWLPFRRGPATTCVCVCLKARLSQSVGSFQRHCLMLQPIPRGTGVSLEPAFSPWWQQWWQFLTRTPRVLTPSAFLKPCKNLAHFRNVVYALSVSINTP